MHRSNAITGHGRKSRRYERGGIAMFSFARRLPFWLRLAGAAGFSAGPLAASTDPAGTGGVASAPWVEPGPLATGQDVSTVPPAAAGSDPSGPAATAMPAPIEEAPVVVVDGAKQSIGRPDIAPIVEVRTTYDDNIFISPTNRQSDYYTTVVAGLALGWGEFRDRLMPLGSFQQNYEQLINSDFDTRQFLFASYTPGYTVFAKHPSENTLDQNASLGARGCFGNLTCDVRADYKLFSEGVAEVGNRVRQSQVNVDFDSQYQISARTSAEVDLNVVTHHYDQNFYVNSSEWIDRNYLGYQVMPKTNVSAGCTLGYVDVDQGSNQTYEQALARIDYDTGQRISANLFGGVEFRQFVDGGASFINPVFNAEIIYSPFDGTNISLSGERVVANSAEYVGENDVITRVSVTLSQAIYQKLTLSLQGSYYNYNYGAGSGGGDIQRTDNGLRFEASAAFHVTPYLAVNLAYDYWHNESNLNPFNFDDNRATLDLDLLF